MPERPRFIKHKIKKPKFSVEDPLTYASWKAMLRGAQKLNNKKSSEADVIQWTWDTFIGFREDMGKRPSKNHRLIRRDKNLGYLEDNCFWGTVEEQHEAGGKRKLSVLQIKKILKYNYNDTHSQTEMAGMFGVTRETISRICSGKQNNDIFIEYHAEREQRKLARRKARENEKAKK